MEYKNWGLFSVHWLNRTRSISQFNKVHFLAGPIYSNWRICLFIEVLSKRLMREWEQNSSKDELSEQRFIYAKCLLLVNTVPLVLDFSFFGRPWHVSSFALTECEQSFCMSFELVSQREANMKVLDWFKEFSCELTFCDNTDGAFMEKLSFDQEFEISEITFVVYVANTRQKRG